jgi:hypothetical protein
MLLVVDSNIRNSDINKFSGGPRDFVEPVRTSSRRITSLRYISITNISIGDNCDNFGTKIIVRDTIKYDNGNTMEIVSLEH